MNWAAASALLLLLQACAGVPRDASLPINDPHEQTNRQLLAATQAVMRPAAQLVGALPGPVHDRLRDVNSNLREPRILANNILQGRIDAAHVALGRFLVNTTLGLGGLFDIAGRAGLEQKSGDFGQTLFVWGVPEGPYVMRVGPGRLGDRIAGHPLGRHLTVGRGGKIEPSQASRRCVHRFL